jgi:penicillin-binding protein 2
MNKLPLIEKAQGYKSYRKNRDFNPSVMLFSLVLLSVILFLLSVFRLFHITVVKGEYFHRLADENRIKQIVIEPQRGDIVDRYGATIVNSDKPNASSEATRIISHRFYQYGAEVAPIIGYRQVADVADIKNDLCMDKLMLGDSIGKKGVEKVYECDLRGKKGKKLLELNAKGQELKTLSVIPPEDGKTITLAMDLELQKKAYALMADKKGSVVATNPTTGELLTLVSTPSFDPQMFEDRDQATIEAALTSSDKPLFNRAAEGAYPPGSIFKIIVATGALEDKKIKEDTKVEDTGQIKAGAATFGNWYFIQYGKTESDVNIVKALQRSNDIFFYKTGEALGVEEIKRWADIFGLGQKNKLPLEQAEGLIPSPFWKEETLKEQWYTGDTYNMAIGQGYTLTTPLQMNGASAVIASGGKLCTPHLLKDEAPECKTLPIKVETLDLVREGMKRACSPGGTGWPFFTFTINGKPMQVGCKTGTAEARGEGSTNPHAWFTVFAPFDKPTINLTVMVENGGQGSDIAAPIAKELLTTYFSRQ